MRIAIVSEYDGQNFVGFQKQSNGRSVAYELEKAFSSLFKCEITIVGCSRTDSGVHAKYHVSSLDIPFYIESSRIPLAINSFLPDDLKVKKAYYVEDDFSARFDSKGKRYIYRIFSSNTPSPLLRGISYYTPHHLDINAMREASQAFIGEHDYGAFYKDDGRNVSTIRVINSINIIENSLCKGLIEIEVIGESFLYNMVRIIAGTLLDVGTGRRLPCEIPLIIENKDRTRAGKTMPPYGLTLEEVFYNPRLEEREVKVLTDRDLQLLSDNKVHPPNIENDH